MLGTRQWKCISESGFAVVRLLSNPTRYIKRVSRIVQGDTRIVQANTSYYLSQLTVSNNTRMVGDAIDNRLTRITRSPDCYRQESLWRRPSPHWLTYSVKFAISVIFDRLSTSSTACSVYVGVGFRSTVSRWVAQLSSRSPQMRSHQHYDRQPCKSISSHPYDLTRHEDTMHKAHKEKARCHPCTQEKTSLRDDALIRHMRIVCPVVDRSGQMTGKENVYD